MTFNYDWLRDHPYWTFEDAVSAVDDQFPGDWLDFWGIGASHAPKHLDPDLWDVANEVHDVARRISHAASGLLREGLPEELRALPALLRDEAHRERDSGKQLADSIEAILTPAQLEQQKVKDLLYVLRYQEGEAEAKSKLFRTAVEIYAYPEFGCSPGDVAARLLDLLEFLVRAHGKRAREYLQRVAVCYIRDMRPELAVMSRAVMEAALQHEVPEVQVERILEINGRRHPNLSDLINAASHSNLRMLDEEGRIAADMVRNAGNHAIHSAPQQVPEARAILENLNLVLGQVDSFEER